MIHLTEAAAWQMRELALGKGLSDRAGLRLVVEKGGCAGLQYEMSITEGQEDDVRFEEHGACLYVDRESLPHLDESVIDYADGLTGAGFRIRNPRAVRSCGCGTSFEPTDPTS